MKTMIALLFAAASISAQAAQAPEFTGIDNWLNSPPLSLQQLRG